MSGIYQFIKFEKKYCILPFQLTYHSIANKDLKMSDIEEIMATSIKNNKIDEITGCLMYNNGFFLQILEGDEKKVRELYETITLDSRNHHNTILSTDDSQFRIFKEWAMAYYQFPPTKDLSPEQAELKEKLISLSDSAKKPNFTMKVFWYNVRQLLLENGYYRSTVNTTS